MWPRVINASSAASLRSTTVNAGACAPLVTREPSGSTTANDTPARPASESTRPCAMPFRLGFM